MTAELLQNYKTLVHFLGKTLGPDYEVVLQDLTENNHEIVAIANSHVSGRTLGSPLTDAALQMLSSKVYERRDFLCCYKGVTEGGKVLRSSTMFIKDDTGVPIGLLCINFDDSRYTELAQKLFTIVHPDSFDIADSQHTLYESNDAGNDISISLTENFPMDMSTLMQKIFEDSTASFTTPSDHFNQQERKEVMVKLNEQGLFQLKGAIPFVAKKFSCSTATVYRYLSEITN